MKSLYSFIYLLIIFLFCTMNSDITDGGSEHPEDGQIAGILLGEGGNTYTEDVNVKLLTKGQGSGIVDSLIDTYFANSGKFLFENIVEGDYAIQVERNDTIIGEYSDFHLAKGEEKNIVINIYIVQINIENLIIDNSVTVSITNIFLGDGKSEVDSSGNYVISTIDKDTQNIALEVKNGDITDTLNLLLINNGDGTFTFIDTEDNSIINIDDGKNNDPEFITNSASVLDTTEANSKYIDTLKAKDIDGDTISFSFIDSVSGMKLSDSIISWTPLLSDTGTHSIKIILTDGNNGYDTLAWSLTVIPPKVVTDSNTLIYCKKVDSLWQIYSNNSSFTNETALTNDSVSCSQPRWSPNGKMITYTRQNSSGRWDIAVMNSDGTNQKQITNTGSDQGTMPSWRFDSQRILYVAGASTTEQIIRSVDINGNNDIILFNNLDDKDLYPVESPRDTNLIAYSYDTGNWAYSRTTRIRDLSTGLDTTIFSRDNYGEYYLKFSNDGQYLLWFSKNNSGDEYIDVLNMDNGNHHTITSKPAASSMTIFGDIDSENNIWYTVSEGVIVFLIKTNIEAISHDTIYTDTMDINMLDVK